MNFAFDTNTKLNIILAILAISLVLAMILVFRKTGEGYESCGEGYAVTCPSSNDACNDNMCAICKANQNNPDYYGKGGCAVCA